jgi:hypothetical protein
MKAQVTEDAAGLHFEIKDDGSAEYRKAAQLTQEVNEREERAREAMLDSQEPIAWAILSDRGVESVFLLEAVAKDKANAFGGDVVALYAVERRFNAKCASVGQLLDRIKRFIDQTDPWTSQVVDRDYKINTPESRNARKALTELRKRLAGLG